MTRRLYRVTVVDDTGRRVERNIYGPPRAPAYRLRRAVRQFAQAWGYPPGAELTIESVITEPERNQP